MPKKFVYLPLFFLMLAVGGPVWLAPSPAAAASCSALRAELARISGGGGNSAQIARLERRAQANGCRGGAMFGRPRICASIDGQIRNLRGGGGDARRARQLRRQIARQCNGSRTREARRQPEPQRQARTHQAPSGVIIHGTRRDNALDERSQGNFFSNLFGGVVERVREPARSANVERIVPDSEHRRANTARSQGGGEGQRRSAGSGDGNWVPRGGDLVTWCVRLCDGYYFPVARGTSSSRYGDQQQLCQARCPGAEVSLYAHRLGTQPESMRSTVSGEPYVDLPTAFIYRTSFNPQCACEPTPAMTRVAWKQEAAEALSKARAGTGREDEESSGADGNRVVLDGEPSRGPDGRVRARLQRASAQDADGAAGTVGETIVTRDDGARTATVTSTAGTDVARTRPDPGLKAALEALPASAPESERAAVYLRYSGPGERQRPGTERLPSGELPSEDAAPARTLPPPPQDGDLPPNAGGPAMAAADAPEPVGPATPLRTRTVGPQFFAMRLSDALSDEAGRAGTAPSAATTAD